MQRKGLWSPDEDEKLRNSIAHHRSGSWSDIARKAGLQRCGKSCRRRWMNHLRPDLKREKFTSEEIRVVTRLHNAMGNKWSEIATHLVGRTDNDVKNLWNTQIKRQLRANQQQISDDQLVIMNNVKSSGPSFPFSVESDFNCIGKLTSEKPDMILHSSYPSTLSTATSLDADSWISSSAVDEPGFYTHISAEALFIDEDQLAKVDPLLTSPCQEANYVCFNNQASSNDQESTLQEAVLMEERFGCLMDGTHLMHTMDALARPKTTLTLPSASVNMHYSYSSCDVASNHVVMMMMENNAGKRQQISNATSSHSTWDGSIISDESSTGTISTMDDTCSVGQPALLQLHRPFTFNQNDDDDHYHQEQQDGADDANQPSRMEFWSFATCDEWLFESLYATNEGYS